MVVVAVVVVVDDDTSIVVLVVADVTVDLAGVAIVAAVNIVVCDNGSC